MIRSEVFSTAHYMTTAGDGLTAEFIEFGFRTKGLTVVNSCGPRLFFNLVTCAATTKDAYLACGESRTMLVETISLTLKTTSTSTGAGLPDARPNVSIHAWASA